MQRGKNSLANCEGFIQLCGLQGNFEFDVI